MWGTLQREKQDDDYENMTPPYKELPPKPDSMAPPRPPKAGKKMKKVSHPGKTRKRTGLDVTPVSYTSQLATPMPRPSQKPGGLGCCWENRLQVCLYLLVMVSLLLGCTGLAVTLIKYQAVVEELRTVTFQQTAWQKNVMGMAGLAGLKKDIDRIRTDTNQSLVELQVLVDSLKMTCPKDWLPFEDKCYYFSKSTKTWDIARKFCQENYSHLVIISSKAEQVFVANAQDSSKVYWLGLTDKNREGDWRWLDGTPATLTFWNSEEPNNHQEEDCASMNVGGSWNDFSCDKTLHWICERKCSC
ncbi:PREDICTED: C-type lectin domain family 17, member A [Chrysochloris asiatica]|uniref:C-type lectin domain family 17, member A n=1 Tax=Chrysochloris asiatica TaxID=185453 RepID=A0A9B0U6G6_CHRAS|nr:PREDICTED: C-type lectin domain family 17, member A [Chrysochloris asiatica]